jgi:hypothetical protein
MLISVFNTAKLPKGSLNQVSYCALDTHPHDTEHEHFHDFVNIINNLKENGKIPVSVTFTNVDAVIVIYDTRRDWDNYLLNP